MIERDFDDGTRLVSRDHPDGAREVSLERDGRSVSRAFIVPMLMRIGAAVVRMDGIGGVGTEEDCRNHGYSRRVMERAVERMRAGDAALSTLFGITDFYPRFGFATVGPEYTMRIPLEPDARPDTLPSGWAFRSFVADDLPAVMRLYHANTRRATGALVRRDAGDEPAENASLARSGPVARQSGRRAWDRLAKLGSDPGEDACRVLLDGSGAVVAYAWIGRGGWWIDFRYRDAREAFHVGEVMAAGPAAADAVLMACRRWATEAGSGVERIEIVNPPEGPVACAAAYEGAAFVATHIRRGMFMGRVLDVGRLLGQVRPELSARIRGSRVEFRGQLTLRTDEGEASLSIAPDGVSVDDGSGDARLVVELPQTALARMCLGAFATDDVLARLPSPPDRETAALLNVLFPRRTPHIHAIDRF